MRGNVPDFSFEDRLGGAAVGSIIGPVVGIDEAGRGPWAGPVVAGAVFLDRDRLAPDLAAALDDSKRLTSGRREALFLRLPGCARIGVGIASAEEIDRLNILRATFLAMARAVDALGVPVGHALVDGNRPPPLPCPVTTVVGGDGKSLSIAAASIVAKVTRDRLMTGLAEVYPGYGWERNMGYGTADHRAGLDRLGVTPEHRKSFAPVASRLASTGSGLLDR
ncbi:MAG: ribonuclease HII [Alphaproteobacteria bacterium]|nr:ribonuclease HII [Alphaproteobacteria bacterium]